MKRKEMPSRKRLEEDIRHMNYREIAAKYNVSQATAGRWLKRYNLHRMKNNEQKNQDESDEAADRSSYDEDTVIGQEVTEPEDSAVQLAELKAVLLSEPLDDILLIGVAPYMPGGTEDDTPGTKLLLAAVEDEAIERLRMAGLPSDRRYHIGREKTYLIFSTFDDGSAASKKRDAIDSLVKFSEEIRERDGAQLTFNVQKGSDFMSVSALFEDTDGRLDQCIARRTAGYYGYNTHSPEYDISHEYKNSETEEPPLLAPIRIPENILKATSALTDESENITDDTSRPEEASQDTVHIQSDPKPDSRSDVTDTGSENNAPESDEIYLIDSENVSASWMQLLDDDPKKQFIVLYTDFTPRVSYDDLAKLRDSKNRIKFHKVYAGEKGASSLDFQLVSMLGFMLRGSSGEKYVIVSRDAGYDPVVRLWEDNGYEVSRLAMVNRMLPEGCRAYAQLTETEKKAVSEGCRNTIGEEMRRPSPIKYRKIKDPIGDSDGKRLDRMMYLQKHLPGRKKEVYEDIMSILNSSEADDLGHIHADFIDVFGGSQGERLFNLIKKKIKGYKNA